MFYPYRENYKCPECKTGIMKWQGQMFASTYVLGYSFCDNPDCVNNEKYFLNPALLLSKIKAETPDKYLDDDVERRLSHED